MKKYRRAVFVVVYSGNEYLVLHRILHWEGWEFPKGGLKSEEGILDGIKREIKEETGLKILSIKKFDISGKYKYDKEYSDRPGVLGQTYTLFAAEIEKRKIDLEKNKDKEHDKFLWVDFDNALKKLTWPNQRKCLRIVNNWLKTKQKLFK